MELGEEDGVVRRQSVAESLPISLNAAGLMQSVLCRGHRSLLSPPAHGGVPANEAFRLILINALYLQANESIMESMVFSVIFVSIFHLLVFLARSASPVLLGVVCLELEDKEGPVCVGGEWTAKG